MDNNPATKTEDLAKQLAQLGYFVFPCKLDKTPATPKGFKDATTDLAKVQAWPWLLIGIACEKSGLFAVDIDTKNGINGLATWEDLITENGTVGNGPCQNTPSGGRHYLFKLPRGIKIPNNAGKLGAGLDLRSNGYICTGPGYTWLPGHGPEVKQVDAPAWLLRKIREITMPVPSPQPAMPTGNNGDGEFWLGKALAKAVPGNRNETGMWLAIQLRDNNVSRGEADSLLRSYAARVPQPHGQPYTESEALASLKEAYSKPPREPARGKASSIVTDQAPAAPAVSQKPETAKKTRWTVAELYATEFPEPSWIIPTIWPVGLTFFGGRPKIGKSWFLLQLAYAVSTGGMMFDQKITQGDVFYLSLEDSPKRLLDRCKVQGIPGNAPITFERVWKPLHQGGLDDLFIEIKSHDYRLIIIDTLARATPGVDHSDPKIIGQVINQLQEISLGENISISLADHTRKPNGIFNDPIDDIMGSTAKAAAADAVLAIYRDQGKAGANLKGRGKDIEEIDLTLMFDKVTCCWQNKGNSSELDLTDLRRDIIEFLKVHGKSQEATISKGLEKNRGNMFHTLTAMVNAGLLRKEKIEDKVFYDLPAV